MVRKFGIGQAVRRTEDPRLLRGRGCFTDDLSRPGQLYACFVRSPHAHALILELDVSAALASPGVVAVFTAEELRAGGVADLPCDVSLTNRDGSAMASPPRPALARERVRHAGEAVAMVVADSAVQARDAAEQVLVSYDPLPVAVETGRARAADAAPVWPELAPGNVCFDWDIGDAAAVEAAFATASHRVTLDLINNRVIANPLEPRVILAWPEEDGRLAVAVPSQGVHDMRAGLAATLRLDEERLRVMTPDVGGGFGMKIFLYPEYVAVAHAARVLHRPVKWCAERSEGFLADNHGRDNVSRAELALDAEGHFLALRVETVANMGAYLSGYAPYVPTHSAAPMLAGVYRTPAIHARIIGVFTHTAPVDAYRGAGRPEAAYLVERLVDVAARTLGLSPIALRRRNFIPAAAMPWQTPLGLVYDSGDFARTLDEALVSADAAGFPARRAEAQSRGRRLGLGVACYIEHCAGGGPELAALELRADGTVLVLMGSQSNGQGHETAYTQIVADRLGLPPEAITIHQGDTARLRWGSGTGGSRAAAVGGGALVEGCGRLIAAARPVAARLLDVAESDVTFTEGGFGAPGRNQWLTWASVAAASGECALKSESKWRPSAGTFPNGTHLCEVEVDPETGAVVVRRYTVVDDFGLVLNPLLCAGQVQGGVAQGIGQALMEHTHYDPETGQLITGSFGDYALPRASDIPGVRLSFANTPTTANTLGIKGAGEAGAIGAPPAVINALMDALAEDGVVHLDMPATPERVWSALAR